MSYCKYCRDPNAHEVHRVYHDNHYGFPILDDNELFGRLILEINQAGLSWETILKKKVVSEMLMLILIFTRLQTSEQLKGNDY